MPTACPTTRSLMVFTVLSQGNLHNPPQFLVTLYPQLLSYITIKSINPGT